MRLVRVFLFFGALLLIRESQAQLKSVGLIYQNQLNPTDAQHLGIEFGNSNNRIDFGFAGLANLDKPEDGYKANVHIDFLFKNWHHAYLANRWSPYLGLQYEANQIGAQEQSVNHNVGGRAGLKISYDYLVFDLGYLYTPNYGLAFGKIAYVFHVGNACSNKRIGEIHPWNILEF